MYSYEHIHMYPFMHITFMLTSIYHNSSHIIYVAYSYVHSIHTYLHHWCTIWYHWYQLHLPTLSASLLGHKLKIKGRHILQLLRRTWVPISLTYSKEEISLVLKLLLKGLGDNRRVTEVKECCLERQVLCGACWVCSWNGDIPGRRQGLGPQNWKGHGHQSL